MSMDSPFSTDGQVASGAPLFWLNYADCITWIRERDIELVKKSLKGHQLTSFSDPIQIDTTPKHMPSVESAASLLRKKCKNRDIRVRNQGSDASNNQASSLIEDQNWPSYFYDADDVFDAFPPLDQSDSMRLHGEIWLTTEEAASMVVHAHSGAMGNETSYRWLLDNAAKGTLVVKGIGSDIARRIAGSDTGWQGFEFQIRARWAQSSIAAALPVLAKPGYEAPTQSVKTFSGKNARGAGAKRNVYYGSVMAMAGAWLEDRDYSLGDEISSNVLRECKAAMRDFAQHLEDEDTLAPPADWDPKKHKAADTETIRKWFHEARDAHLKWRAWQRATRN